MKLLTKIATIGCGFSGISALSATYAYAYSDKPTNNNLTKVEETKKTDGLFAGTKEFDFVGNSFFDFVPDNNWF